MNTRPPAPAGRRSRSFTTAVWALSAAVLVLVSACTASDEPGSSVPGTADVPSVSSPRTTASASASTTPTVTGVAVSTTIEGFDVPWDLRFLPDGTPLVTERPGRISAVVDGERRVVAEVPGVVAQGEGGLMGLALDPDFADNRLIYTCFASGSGGSVRDVRVVRFRLSEGLDALTDQEPLVTGIPAGAGNRHLGCRLEIGPDGMLWITMGDAVQAAAPQDPTSRGGKVLRATLSGEPAPDNPGGRWDPYVYTIGHRNPQGLTFRASDGAAFEVEHGTGCDDEINQLTAGANYGWDPNTTSGSYAEDAPMTSPEIEGAVSPVWVSGCPTVAPSGAEFISGPQWGQWKDQMAVAVLKDEELLLVALDGDKVDEVATELEGTLGRLRTVRNAPDGSLWLTTDASPGSLVRVVPEP